MKVTLDHTEEITQNIRTFWFKPEHPVRYNAGQFTEIKLPHENADERGSKRWFTLSSSPSEELLSITTKFAGESGSSFKRTLAQLEPGTELQLASPMGDFVLPKDPSIPLIFVAGGIGCTPFRSMIKYLNDKGEERDITLLYGANTVEEVAFKNIFATLGDKFKIIPSSPPADWDGPSGRLTAEGIIEIAQPSESHYIYVSGPEPMVEKLTDNLQAQGINKKQIHTDFFPGYTEV